MSGDEFLSAVRTVPLAFAACRINGVWRVYIKNARLSRGANGRWSD